MCRSPASLAVALVMLASAACRGGHVPAAKVEDAYRANNLGVALLEQFNYDAAAAAFRQALGLSSSLAIAHLNLSLALLYAHDLEGAGREAREAARLLPSSSPQPPYVLGLIARLENRNEDAARLFERVRQIDSRDVGAIVNLGQIYLQDRKYTEAIAVLGPAVADEPYNVTAAYNLGMALMRAGRRDEGQRMVERSQTLRTTGYSVTFGLSYLEQGRYAEAIASTGAEPDLIAATMPRAAFAPVALASMTAVAAPLPSPFGRTFSAGDLTPDGVHRLAASLGGGLTLIDIDGDGDLDLFVAAAGRQRLFRNEGRGSWTDVTAGSGLASVPPNVVPIGAVAGDYDNDGVADLFVLREGGSALYHNDRGGHFVDVTAKTGLPPYPFLPSAAAWVDIDHDGDLDLVVAGLADVEATRRQNGGRTVIFPREFVPAPLQLLRNNGNGTFRDITREAHLDVSVHGVAIVPTDFDNRRDIDLLIVNSGLPPMLFKNVRDGTFRDVAADVGLVAAVGSNNDVAAVAAGDVNKDGFPDFFFARTSGGVFALSDSYGRFTRGAAPSGTSAAAVQLIDYDNDGLLDLLTWAPDGPHLFRNLGARWMDVSGTAILRAAGESRPLVHDDGDALPLFPASARGVAVADLDGDGNSDVVVGGAGPSGLWRNRGDDRRRALPVRLKGLASNRLGVGSKIELRAGSLIARMETSAATPAVAPADVVFGLGSHTRADVVRVLWPSGVLQAETPAAASPAATPMTPMTPMSIVELNRKPSSCPFLFTWNGTRFEFVTDFMGGGEMGYWERPGERNRPDPIEYVRIGGDQLLPKEGRFEIRVTNELEETLYADRFELVAIAHPREIDVFPNEGLTEPPKPFRLYAVSDQRAPARAVDDHGHDVTDAVARIDRRYPDDFALTSVRGYAATHTLTIDVGPARAVSPVLLLTGWTDYAFSSDNVAAHQAGRSLAAPSLQIRDAAGAWRTAIGDIGIPVGRPQTIVVDLTGRIRPGEHEVRLVTNMPIYWDRILVATPAPADRLRMVRINPLVAMLGSRGFSTVVKPDGKDPESYDYQRVTASSPWKTMPGRYTREGDVRELLARSDDMFVIAKPGDEIALSFDAAAVGPLPDGWTRTFLLMADGFSKEMDINSASPDAVEPLPFHAMRRYPYAPPEHYPDTAAHRAYRDQYNTRVVARTLPTLVAPGPMSR